MNTRLTMGGRTGVRCIEEGTEKLNVEAGGCPTGASGDGLEGTEKLNVEGAGCPTGASEDGLCENGLWCDCPPCIWGPIESEELFIIRAMLVMARCGDGDVLVSWICWTREHLYGHRVAVLNFLFVERVCKARRGGVTARPNG